MTDPITTDPITIVIPALNEAATVGSVVSAVIALAPVHEVIVVDNASTDATAKTARAAGARVVHEPTPGLGHAIKSGYRAATTPWVMKLDADLTVFDPQLVGKLSHARTSGVGMVKGLWEDPDDDLPMTRLLILPAIRLVVPGLAHIKGPNSGQYLFNRDLIDIDAIPDNNSADIDVMLRVHNTGATIAEVEIGQIGHDARNRPHYNAMAENILNLFLMRHAGKPG